MIEKIKKYFILDCVVFTLMTIVIQTFYKVSGFIEYFSSMSFVDYYNIILQYFAVSTTMAFLFFVSDLIFGDIDGIKSHILSLAIVVGTVFSEGGLLFKWFDLKSVYTLLVLLIIAIIYCIVWFLGYAKDVDDFKQINKKIAENQEVENE